ncbi:MAG: hypothetical protein S4CHLAM37_02880 [Chlamydiia bacterium]|nr:hypothetical protein [Chlamydiia bacterium]
MKIHTNHNQGIHTLAADTYDAFQTRVNECQEKLGGRLNRLEKLKNERVRDILKIEITYLVSQGRYDLQPLLDNPLFQD